MIDVAALGPAACLPISGTLMCPTRPAGELLLVMCLVLAASVLSASFAVFLVRCAGGSHRWLDGACLGNSTCAHMTLCPARVPCTPASTAALLLSRSLASPPHPLVSQGACQRQQGGAARGGCAGQRLLGGQPALRPRAVLGELYVPCAAFAAACMVAGGAACC